MRVSLNTEQSVFVISTQDGYTCLGFKVCQQWTRDIAQELGRSDLEPTAFGTLDAYRQYEAVLEAARLRVSSGGQRLQCHLTPQLIGLEGKRVEVVDQHLDWRSFVVGRSCGFLPVHLELASERARYGEPVSGAPFDFLRVCSGAPRASRARLRRQAVVPAGVSP